MRKLSYVYGLFVSLVTIAAVGSAAAQPKKSQDVVFGPPKPFIAADKSFSISIPNNWKITDTSTPGEAILQAADPTTNAMIVLHVLNSPAKLGDERLAKLLNLFLDQTTTTFKDFSKGEPAKQSDGSFAVYFKFNETVGEEKIPVSGDAFAQEEGGKVALIFLVMPTEQYDEKKNAAYQMINSFKILGPAN